MHFYRVLHLKTTLIVRVRKRDTLLPVECPLGSRGDKTRLELFLAGLQCWDAAVRRQFVDATSPEKEVAFRVQIALE